MRKRRGDLGRRRKDGLRRREVCCARGVEWVMTRLNGPRDRRCSCGVARLPVRERRCLIGSRNGPPPDRPRRFAAGCRPGRDRASPKQRRRARAADQAAVTLSNGAVRSSPCRSASGARRWMRRWTPARQAFGSCRGRARGAGDATAGRGAGGSTATPRARGLRGRHRRGGRDAGALCGPARRCT